MTGTFLLSSPQITSFRPLLYSYVKLHSIATEDMLIQYINVYGYTVQAILLHICTSTGAGVLFYEFQTNFEIWLYRYSFGSTSSPHLPHPNPVFAFWNSEGTGEICLKHWRGMSEMCQPHSAFRTPFGLRCRCLSLTSLSNVSSISLQSLGCFTR